MKKRFHSLALAISIIILMLAACSKEDAINPLQPTLPTSPSPPANHVAPIAHAGDDTTIYVPFSNHTLNGSASTGNIVSYEWKMINSPSKTDTIRHESQVDAKKLIDGLINIGVYEFELTVTDSFNLKSKDRVKINVVEAVCTSANKEVIVKGLEWIQFWGMWISINNVFSYMPTNSYIKNLYIKRDGSDQWELIVPYYKTDPAKPYENYTWKHIKYFDNNLLLQIYPNNNTTDDTPDIKIEYCN